jgi:hypothetical protein
MSASRDGTVRLVGGSGQIKGMPGCYERIVAAIKKGVEPTCVPLSLVGEQYDQCMD